MSRSRVLFLLLSLTIMLPLVSSGLRRALAEGGGEDSLYRQLSVFSEVLHLIRRAYVDEVEPETLLAAALDGASDALDPLSTFVPAEQVDGYAAVREIGAARSGLTIVKQRGITQVVAVAPGSPAEGAGFAPRDVLVEIDEVSTRRMPLWRIQSLLSGEPGTQLAVSLLRRGQPEELELELANYERRPVSLEVLDSERVLRLYECSPATVGEIEAALAKLTAAGGERLLIDLRGVAGGDPSLAYGIGELFAGGRLGSLRGREGELVSYAGTAQPRWQGALVVLIDRGTMGCAELLATILKQSAGAHLVGLPSFGHAGRMEMMSLSNGAGLFTTAAFYAGADDEPLTEPLAPDTRVEETTASSSDEDEQRPADQILERGLELLRSSEDELRRAA